MVSVFYNLNLRSQFFEECDTSLKAVCVYEWHLTSQSNYIILAPYHLDRGDQTSKMALPGIHAV